MKRHTYWMAASFAVLFFSASIVLSQTSSGDISGRAVDQAGAAIVDAQVTLTNQLTSQKLATTTDRSGNFAFVSVQPGTFSVTVVAAGFSVRGFIARASAASGIV